MLANGEVDSIFAQDAKGLYEAANILKKLEK